MSEMRWMAQIVRMQGSAERPQAGSGCLAQKAGPRWGETGVQPIGRPGVLGILRTIAG